MSVRHGFMGLLGDPGHHKAKIKSLLTSLYIEKERGILMWKIKMAKSSPKKR